MIKGLEALNTLAYLEEYKYAGHPLGDEYSNEFHTISKELKALEIIKRKELNIYFVKRMSLEDFNFSCQYQQQLTKEEYDLLRKVLNR